MEAEIKLILHRLDELSREQRSGLSEIKTRISHIEESQQRVAVFQGRTEQRLENLEKEKENASESSGGILGGIAKSSLALVATALGIISALVTNALR